MTEQEKTENSGVESQLWELAEKESRLKRLDLIFKAYSVLGVGFSVIAASLFLIRRVDVIAGSPDQLLILVAGAGILMSLISFLYLLLRREKDRENFEKIESTLAAGSFIEAWADFETKSAEALQARDINFNRTSIRDTLSKLTAQGLIDESDLSSAELILKFRNMLVHGRSTIDRRMLNVMTQRIIRLTQRIKA